jgi:hypothetical protein
LFGQKEATDTVSIVVVVVVVALFASLEATNFQSYYQCQAFSIHSAPAEANQEAAASNNKATKLRTRKVLKSDE